MTTPIVELKHVSMGFKKGSVFKKSVAQVISQVSLDLKEGEILALVGESGCGKTTLGKIVLGLLRPTEGEVLYMGKDLWRRGAGKVRPMGQIVHQDSYASLNPVRTIYQTLSAPLLRYGTKRKELKTEVKGILQFIGVIPPEYFLNKYPYHLSGGMRQRVVVARALIPKPKFIVADEPVSMIDPSLRLSILDLLMKLNEEMGTALLYITHDLATARYIGRRGRIAVMYLGQIVEKAGLAEAFQRPLHPYLQALLSAAPIPDPRIAKKRKPLPLKSLDVPSVDNLPSGCRFHTRCPYAKDICTTEAPELKEYENGHWVACHYTGVIPPWSLT